MNYADDRLDRRARCDGEGDNSLWQDYCQALVGAANVINHELLGRTLRDVGWNRHASYHYALHWCAHPDSERACGDFAQMAEFAGFAEVGVLAILAFRYKQTPCVPWRQPEASCVADADGGDGDHDDDGDVKSTFKCVVSPPKDETWLLNPPPAKGSCGCGDKHCGKFTCFLPLLQEQSALDTIIGDLQEYHHKSNPSIRTVPVSGQILNYQAGKGKLHSLPEPDIPPGLKFWTSGNEDETGEFRTLTPLLQMLLIKLLYVCMPQLAAEAVCHATIPDSNPTLTSTATRQPLVVVNEKSHRAYFVLIRAVVLGERVKAHRKQLHKPLWEQFWQSSSRVTTEGPSTMMFFDHLKQLARPVSFACPPPTLGWVVPTTTSQMAVDPIFLVGDSHVLSLAWQVIEIPNETNSTPIRRLVVPVVVTGLKAWHVRCETRFFTRTNLLTMLQRLPSSRSRTILFSAGEIDCREGLGGKQLEGYQQKCLEHVKRTVAAFTNALCDLSKKVDKEILVLPVAPHGYRKTGRVASQQSRRETMAAWNAEMRQALPVENVYFLDYADSLLDPKQEGFVLNPQLNADGTHMNSGFGPLLAKAVVDSGCDMSRL